MRVDARLRAGAAGAALALAAWYPASGQQRPESILPPGFGQPAAPAPPRPLPSPRASTSPRPAAPQTRATAEVATPAALPTPSAATAMVQPLPGVTPSASPTPSPTPTIDAATLARYELPLAARRSLALVGPATERETGFDAAAFGDASGPMLETMMRRMAAPLPSRWLSIALRRLLVAQVDTPLGVNGADFAAERAWLLLRMGEADGARAVVQGVDDANYTGKLLEVAMNAMLATGDPVGLCPLADRGRATTAERGWVVAQAMCAGLAGTPGKAGPLIAAARRRHVASGIDLALAQKVVGAGPDGGRAVTIEWAGVDRLTIWRFGLALATGVPMPDPLLAAASLQVTGWRATAPQVAVPDRLAAADTAAAQGVLSNAALVDLYGTVAAMDEPPAAASAVADDLRNAYVGATADERMAAMHSLWGGGSQRPPYARLVLTARAAARITPAVGNKDAAALIAAMLSAGLDRTAARWNGSVDAGGDAWAMLALADPEARRLTYRDLAAYAGSGDAALKQRLFFAGLAGLGRLAPEDVERSAQALDIRIGAENSWTRALDRAARDNQPGTVVLLAALGMQTGGWRGVPPVMLYRIVGALRAVGLGGEARMIAAEALARA
jgi:hypothetical protein